jgi:hypothetical protein
MMSLFLYADVFMSLKMVKQLTKTEQKQQRDTVMSVFCRCVTEYCLLRTRLRRKTAI